MMPCVRTTVRLDDERLPTLKEQARKQIIFLPRLLDRTLRAGLQALCEPRRPRGPYRE